LIETRGEGLLRSNIEPVLLRVGTTVDQQ